MCLYICIFDVINISVNHRILYNGLVCIIIVLWDKIIEFLLLFTHWQAFLFWLHLGQLTSKYITNNSVYVIFILNLHFFIIYVGWIGEGTGTKVPHGAPLIPMRCYIDCYNVTISRFKLLYLCVEEYWDKSRAMNVHSLFVTVFMGYFAYFFASLFLLFDFFMVRGT